MTINPSEMKPGLREAALEKAFQEQGSDQAYLDLMKQIEEAHTPAELDAAQKALEAYAAGSKTLLSVKDSLQPTRSND